MTAATSASPRGSTSTPTQIRFTAPDPPPIAFTRRDPEPPLFRTVARLFQWLIALNKLAIVLFLDRLRRRATPRQRGVRMRQMFERMGGTAVKVGQQMSVRIDLLPWDVCDELSKLQDSAPPFDSQIAVACVETATGGPLTSAFEAFDPDPIGSASIACVYQAVLRGGQKVAVKVRRPGIVLKFATDLRVIDWLTQFPEIVGLVKPAFFKYLRSELRQMLMEELDFEAEARYQRLFRRAARKVRLKWLSAPRVIGELSSDSVIVTEFVEGIWCRELVAALESEDRHAKEIAQSFGISPEKVARRLLMTQFWSSYESLFFHADPHPANILIQPGGRMIFVDFGSCGTTSAHVRRNQTALLDALVLNDIASMVDAALHLIEPLPPIDVHLLRRRIQDIYESQLLAIRDKESEWWERTTMGLWMAMVQVTREFKLPINLDVIRQFRCSLLYDTLAFRICPDLKVPDVYRRYRKGALRRSARQALKRAARNGPRQRVDSAVAAWDSLTSDLERAVRRVQNAADSLPVNFLAVVAKGAYAVSALVRFGVIVAVIITLALLLQAGWQLAFHRPAPSWSAMLANASENPWALAIIALFALRVFRQILIRLQDRDSQTGRQLPGRPKT